MGARLTEHEKHLRTIPEKQLQKTMEEMLTFLGWLWFHAPDNRPINGRIQNIKAGFPDLIAVRGTRMVYIELKTMTGKVSPDQERWHTALRRAGAEVYVWRPCDVNEARDILSFNKP
jgi:VRR-NUC domain